ncbi:MAG TPA: hypothetical protein VGK73_31490 [Polyangiaceae bacterium]
MTKRTPIRDALAFIRARSLETEAERQARRDAALELAVAKQLEDAARAKRKAREALPRANAALRTAFTCPEGWESVELIESSFANSCGRRS